MNLLPKSHQEFSQKEYWDSFFKKRGAKAFEWYGEYPELSGYLHKYIKQNDAILISGCGNSTLGRDLYDIGYSNVINIDISQVVIRQMLSQTEKERPSLKYLQMDVLEMGFENESFNVVLDKGTLDALMPNEDKDTLDKIQKYFAEIQRVLKIAGRYICITLLQEHILKSLLQYFPQNNFMFRVVRCPEAENEDNSLPVFIVICTKFKCLPRQILELGSGEQIQRLASTEDIQDQVKNIQNVALICSSLKKSSIQDDEISLDLFQVGNPAPRFTVYIVDIKSEARNAQYAAFIVPQGREAEWLFATKPGRQHLTKVTKTNRLAIVTLHRGHKFGSFEEVQAELTHAVCSFAPANLKNKKIPFLSLGSEVGNRVVRHEGTSPVSGKYVVEDVEIDGRTFRRLFFMTSQLVIQSEARLGKKGADLTHLTCRHHVYMSLAAHLVTGSGQKKVAVVGLGGGGLCSFLVKFLPDVHVTAVDLDPEMLQVAKAWFGLVESDRMRVVIQDGVAFLKAAAGQAFDAILFDVDSKDAAIGMSCPPKEFLDDDVLSDVAKLAKDGIFVLNLVLRDSSLRPGIVGALKEKFHVVVSYKLAEDLNEIFICCGDKWDFDALKKCLSEGIVQINRFFKRHQHSDDAIDAADYLDNLKLINL